MRALTWDIFCTVVDNYGDVGVCWRLARQLADEHRRKVRLWVDRLECLHALCPDIDAGNPLQCCRGVEVRRWSDSLPAVTPAEVVIEAFACELPAAYVDAMTRMARPPVWLNLEYLCAEPWVRACHGLASPHPRLPLTKYFFFPGFEAGTGGLLAERGLATARVEFQRNPGALAAFWQSVGLAPTAPDTKRVSLFCYDQAPVEEMLAAWSAAGSRTVCIVPEGPVSARVTAWLGTAVPGSRGYSRGALQIHRIPFLEQDRYDRLLWACDLNFVRGEDSFVRAQWAARPMVWQIYPQREGAHWPKLSAFRDLYCKDLPADAAAAVQGFWNAWNCGEGTAAAWEPFRSALPTLGRHAAVWAERLAVQEDLAARLVSFARDRLK